MLYKFLTCDACEGEDTKRQNRYRLHSHRLCVELNVMSLNKFALYRPFYGEI